MYTNYIYTYSWTVAYSKECDTHTQSHVTHTHKDHAT